MTESWGKRHSWLVVIGVVVIVLLLILGATRGQKRDVTGAALAQLIEADSWQLDSELIINLPPLLRGKERPFTKTTVQLKGDVKKYEEGAREWSGTLYLEARGRGNIFFADGEGRILRERVLFNLENLPVFFNPSGSLVTRWTEVEVDLLGAGNPSEVREALAGALSKLNHVGEDMLEGESLERYTATFSQEDEQAVADVLRQSVSGSRAWHVIARLLDANEVRSLDVWINSETGELRQISAHFVRPLRDGREFDFARLRLTFTEYDKEVEIDQPEHELTVRPGVFAKILGGGEIQEVQLDQSQE